MKTRSYGTRSPTGPAMSEMVVLTLSRIWYSAATGKIAPKDVANRAMEHLPAQHQSVLLEARQAYLGQEEDRSVLRR